MCTFDLLMPWQEVTVSSFLHLRQRHLTKGSLRDRDRLFHFDFNPHGIARPPPARGAIHVFGSVCASACLYASKICERESMQLSHTFVVVDRVLLAAGHLVAVGATHRRRHAPLCSPARGLPGVAPFSLFGNGEEKQNTTLRFVSHCLSTSFHSKWCG